MAEGIEVEISSASSDSETPSRLELLSIVRRHSDFLKEGMLDELDDCDVEMDGRFWHQMLDLYFIESRESKGRHEDDLVFFVRSTFVQTSEGYNLNKEGRGVAPYFVRRWAPQVEKVIGESSAEVDWRRSFYLNLIAHTSFTVTVAICSVQALQNYQKGLDSSVSTVYKVVKTVFASPNRVNFQLESDKGTESVPAYPNLCFSIDDFDDTFDAVSVPMLTQSRSVSQFTHGLFSTVLSERDHCYCVLLNAYGGAAFPAKKAGDNVGFTSSITENDVEKAKESKLTLFSGFVSYPMVREAYEAGRSKFANFLSFGHVPSKTDRLYMRGPGGCGEVEVAVSGIADQSQQSPTHQSPIQLPKGGLGIGVGTIMRKAASAASEAAKHAYGAASDRKDDMELLPLKCCLMSITLPWEHLAQDLLFKSSPPIRL